VSARRKRKRSGPSGPTIPQEIRVLRDQHRVQFSLAGRTVALIDAIHAELNLSRSEVVERAVRLYFASLPRDDD
jgi:hypothetical protein